MVYGINLKEQFQPAKFETISSFLNIILPALTTGATIIFLAMGLYGGFLWITSGGSKENLAKAQKVLVNAIIGFLLVVFGFVFVKIIGFIFQVNTLP